MEGEIQIHKLSQERLDNALHLDFHGTIGERLSDVNLEKVGLTKSLAVEYEKCIRDETAMIKESRKRPETEEIAAKEKECNRRLSYFMAPSDAVRTEIETVANRLSVITAEINTAYKQSLSQRRAKAAKREARGKE